MPDPLFGSLAIVVVVLIVFTAGASFSNPLRRRLRDAEVRVRIRMWWYIVGGFFLALAFSRTLSVIALGLLSFVAFKEFLTLAPTRRADSKVLLWAYLTIPLQFLWAGTGWYGMFIVFIPVYVFLLLPMRMVLLGETHGFLRAVGVLHWGLMTTVFCVSHLAFLIVLPDLPQLKNSGVSLLFYLVILTQFNDGVQFMVNKRFGRHEILGKVRPGISREGMLAGIGLTALAAVALAPLFTPFSTIQAVTAGLMIGLFGFIGFVAITAVERDLGVVESRDFLPGHGGLLLRLDSMMFTAPLFFHFVYYLFY
ncbi:MAG: phosphatidate cytidylyltransferase [Betaproteobacteria bacterium]